MMQRFVSSYIATQYDASTRLEACRTCDKMNSLMLCDQCGCFMPAKVRLKHSYCPIQVWGPIEDDGKQHPISSEYFEELNKD
jgi:hypothetical protein